DAWTHALTELAAGGPDLDRYRPLAELLGRRTAEMHLALASRADDPAFAPEPTRTQDARSVYQSIRSLSGQVLPLLRQRLPRRPPPGPARTPGGRSPGGSGCTSASAA